ncbi:MAG TPA: pilin [Candidatus Saccharimonadales bacterium]|nr:pilin [Candidatus Saccharimonadales bacterium]
MSLLSLPTTLAALPSQCNISFFELPPWYKYLPLQYDTATKTCIVDDTKFQLLGTGENSGILLIALALIDLALRIAGMVAVAFVIWGGIQYVTSQGDPSNVSKAKNTVLNALVGLVIAMIATGLVVFVGGRLAA